jgi:predicted O-linked N-acetylglucosamine transferase (SPINDLY family)
MMLPAIYESRDHIEEIREGFARDLDNLMESPLGPIASPEHAIGVLPFYLAYHNANNATLMRRVGEVMRKATGWHAMPVGRERHGRIRVGFVSTYFYSHSIGRITHGPIRDLPRDRFEVFVFALAPQPDAMQRSIQTDAEHYHSLPNEVAAARDAIDAAELDALIFADIGMHPTTYFLALHRLAPVQVALWGHPETTGLDTIDYFFTAAGVEAAGAEANYTERLVRPEAFFLGGFQRPAPATPLSRESLGLPLHATVYACLQPAFKLHPDIDAIFAGIFERDPKAHLLLLEGRAAWAHRLRERFAKTLPGHHHRVHWLPTLPHARFMATLACADVSLDPLYFGGGNSSCEALAMGVPLITLPGTHAYGRLSVALCEEMKEARGIAQSAADYVDRAVRLASHPERHALRREIAERAGILFDRRDISLALGDFLESATATSA